MPQTAFGMWRRLAKIGDLDFTGPSRSQRLRFWLLDHLMTLPSFQVMKVLERCDSVEVMFALAFAKQFDQIRVLGPKTLGVDAETLELQVRIDRSPYTADFIWTYPNGSCLVDVYGQDTHRERIVCARVRHRHLIGLGYVIHYLPAELVVRYPHDGWWALRKRESKRLYNASQLDKAAS